MCGISELSLLTLDTSVVYDRDIFCVCFDVMYLGEYNVFDVTLSVYQ